MRTDAVERRLLRLLAFALTIDDVITAGCGAGPANRTPPMLVQSMVRAGVNPHVNVIGTLMITVPRC